MPGVEAEALLFIEQIYGVVADPARWPLLLETLAKAVKAHGGLLRQVDFASDRVGFSETFGYEESFVRAYRDYYVHLDPYRELLLRQPVGAILTTERDTNRQTHLLSEYYNDYERPQDRIHVLGSVLNREHSKLLYFGLHRGERSREFAPRDLRLVRLLLPHLARAVQLQGILDQSSQRQSLAESALDRIRLGVMLVDGHGRPFHLNRAAESLMAGTRALATGPDGLSATKAGDTARLRRLIASAAAVTAGLGVEGGGDLQVMAPDGRTALQIWVTPLSRPQLDATFRAPAECAAVFVSRAGTVSLPWRRLANHYGLTPAEARLAASLCEGMSLEEATSLAGVSIHTARSQLKTVFAKTGARRQSELTAMLLGGVLSMCHAEGEET